MNIAVLGGGVTGLTAAWRLSAAGHSVRLFEATGRLGGCIRTEIAGGWLVEAGPNSFLESLQPVGALVEELGLGPERIEASPASGKRFIVHKGGLRALPSPSSPLAFLSTPLFSLGSKARAAFEIARSPRARDADVSVAQLTREHFGSEMLERVVQPFVSGIYAGDPERLSARHAFPRIWEAERVSGSLIRAGAARARRRRAAGLRSPPAMVSFRAGLQALTDAMASRLPSGSVVLNAEVRSAGPGLGARWRVHWADAHGARGEDFDSVVAALPALALSRLEIGKGGGRPLAGLGAIVHPPVASVFVGMRRDQVRHPLDGFGVLVPSGERRSILGVVFNSSLFEGRAPAGHVALTALAGGVLQSDVARLPGDELFARVSEDLRWLLGTRGEPTFVRSALWQHAIPQYDLGYGRHLEAMAACEKGNPGLLIGGNARDGISLPECIMSGASLAERALRERAP